MNPSAGREPEPARATYLIEEDYFFDRHNPAEVKDISHFRRAIRVTVRCLSHWADRYEAHPVIGGNPIREGSLPDDLRGREALINSVLDWLEALPGAFGGSALSLFAGNTLLLQGGDGLPGALVLNQDEFTAMQNCWVRHDLPQDLYYPALERRQVVEPVRRFGGVVRTLQFYTPRQWASRDQEVIELLQVPGDEQRKADFVAACRQFQQTIRLRFAELREPGSEPDDELLAAIARVDSDVRRLILRSEAYGDSSPGRVDG